MKKLIGIALLISAMFLGNSGVSAMSPTYPYAIKFSRGVTNTCYYIDSSASVYTSDINTVAQQWAGMNNRIVNTAVSSSYATHIDIYGHTPQNDTVLNSDVLGYTTLWSSTGSTVYWYGVNNYFYTEIVMNKWGMATATKVLAHEFGHAYGLYENEANSYSIMYPYYDGMMVSTPQSTDNDTINYLYP